MNFKLRSPFKPTADQPWAINKLVKGINCGVKYQVLLGVTGSGKTFTMANVINQLNKPTLVISHNKTLAAQLYQEFRDFFPDNAVCFFVSYYDYYLPEAYIPATDTYIEKETDINEEIDKLRLLSTANLLTRGDTIIVASVSCIYNIGSPKMYGNFVLDLRLNLQLSLQSIINRLSQLQYVRANYQFHRGSFRVRGESLDIYPAYQDTAIHIEHDGRNIVLLSTFDPIDGTTIENIEKTVIYPAKHYMTDFQTQDEVFANIRKDLWERVSYFKKKGKLLEADRLKKRVSYDLEMISEVGYVNGIENYSRYFDGRKKGAPPYTLLDYFNQPYSDEWLLFVDESHMSIPQIRGMYHGDRSRKKTLVDYGFRLPAALDNRPLTFSEFLTRIPQTIFVSATPAKWEISQASKATKLSGFKGSTIVEQLIRPTGLPDPQIFVRPTHGQIRDLVMEILKRKQNNQRVLVTTLTKKMAEELAEYLLNPENFGKILKFKSPWPKVHYLHSDIATLQRTDILDDLRTGVYDVIIGINLLREGLDLPEVSLVAILDADKEGFLRSQTALIQTMGRAARNAAGEVIMYADELTKSMKAAIKEVGRRRQLQLEYNKKHGIRPTTIKKDIREKLVSRDIPAKADFGLVPSDDYLDQLLPDERIKLKKSLHREMKKAASALDFELAAKLRDTIQRLRSIQ